MVPEMESGTQKGVLTMATQIMKLDIPYNGTWKILDHQEGPTRFYLYYEKAGSRSLKGKFTCIVDCLNYITNLARK